MHEDTMTFHLNGDKKNELRNKLTVVYKSLKDKGYSPVNQIVGYILSEDPTYITTYNNARNIIRQIDRDELLKILVESFVDGEI